MKYNQFSQTLPSEATQLSELQRIALYPVDIAQYSFAQIVTHVYQHLFPECSSPETIEDQFDRLLVGPHNNLANYLTSIEKTVDQKAFYNVALQLLGFFTPESFNLAEPLTAFKAMSLPYLDQSELDFTSFTTAIYCLLTTRAKNGADYLDNLASRGYFKRNLSREERQHPLIFNGKTQAVFDADNFITEVVYVESDLDTDADGQRDLLETTIIRPNLDSSYLKIPALYTANPYFKGTTNAKMNSVDDEWTIKTTGDARNTADEFDQFNSFPRLTAFDKKQDPFAQNNAVLTATGINTVVLNDYFLPRGFASVYAAGIGTRGSDGIRTCGSPEETNATIAIIEWLHGDRLAFSDRTRTATIMASWCNGRVAMTGKSYLGTMAVAAATTGVAGLETVISEAAISSWYDYYRENGLVVAPQTFQGEDANVLTDECFSRQKDAGDYLRVQDFYQKKLAQMSKDQDRLTGSYNYFWELRNYRNQVEQVQCPIVSVHGLNDWNVKPKNVYKLNQALIEKGKIHKVILHQGPHIYINDLLSLDFYDLINLWLGEYLLQIDNKATAIMPDYLIQSNKNPERWLTPKTWDSEKSKQMGLCEFGQTSTTTERFCDDGVVTFKQSGLNDLAWEHCFINQDTRFSTNQIVLKTAKLTKPTWITGRPELKLQVKSSQHYGLLSVMLVDYGLSHRLSARPQIIELEGRQLSYKGATVNTQAFIHEKTVSPAKLIAKGHLNLQNRHQSYQNEEVLPEEFYQVKLDLQPTYYQLEPGHQLGLIIYATDMGMTKRHVNNTIYTVDLEHSSLKISYR